MNKVSLHRLQSSRYKSILDRKKVYLERNCYALKRKPISWDIVNIFALVRNDKIKGGKADKNDKVGFKKYKNL